MTDWQRALADAFREHSKFGGSCGSSGSRRTNVSNGAMFGDTCCGTTPEAHVVPVVPANDGQHELADAFREHSKFGGSCGSSGSRRTNVSNGAVFGDTCCGTTPEAHLVPVVPAPSPERAAGRREGGRYCGQCSCPCFLVVHRSMAARPCRAEPNGTDPRVCPGTMDSPDRWGNRLPRRLGANGRSARLVDAGRVRCPPRSTGGSLRRHGTGAVAGRWRAHGSRSDARNDAHADRKQTHLPTPASTGRGPDLVRSDRRQ